jgi:hypothetical protein
MLKGSVSVFAVNRVASRLGGRMQLKVGSNVNPGTKTFGRVCARASQIFCSVFKLSLARRPSDGVRVIMGTQATKATLDDIKLLLAQHTARLDAIRANLQRTNARARLGCGIPHGAQRSSYLRRSLVELASVG